MRVCCRSSAMGCITIPSPPFLDRFQQTSRNWYEVFSKKMISLPEDLQLLFNAVAVEAIQYSDELNRAAEDAMIRKLGEVLQVNFLSGDELKPFQELARGVYEHFVGQGVFTTEEILQAKAIARGKGAAAQ